GRNADLLEIAGKRASLGDLTRRLQAVPGVEDGVVFQLDRPGPGGVRRIAALAVAPSLDEAAIRAALAESVDPVFLPRPLKRVPALPRNATGKLPRAALLALIGDPSHSSCREIRLLRLTELLTRPSRPGEQTSRAPEWGAGPPESMHKER